MNNGFRPSTGQKCKVVGNCHPNLLGKVVDITYVDNDGVECKYFDAKLRQEVFTSGKHGGFVLVSDTSG